MKTITDLIELSQNYDNAESRKNERIKLWMNTQYQIVQSTLSEISIALENSIAFFRQNIFINANSDNPMEGLALRSGLVKVGSGFEDGFQIQFSPLYNGKILILAFEHTEKDSSDRSEEIDIVDPEELTPAKVTDLIYKALEKVQKTSILFIGY